MHLWLRAAFAFFKLQTVYVNMQDYIYYSTFFIFFDVWFIHAPFICVTWLNKNITHSKMKVFFPNDSFSEPSFGYVISSGGRPKGIEENYNHNKPTCFNDNGYNIAIKKPAVNNRNATIVQENTINTSWFNMIHLHHSRPDPVLPTIGFLLPYDVAANVYRPRAVKGHRERRRKTRHAKSWAENIAGCRDVRCHVDFMKFSTSTNSRSCRQWCGIGDDLENRNIYEGNYVTSNSEKKWWNYSSMEWGKASGFFFHYF